MTDQLNLGSRYLMLDPVYFWGAMRLCHCGTTFKWVDKVVDFLEKVRLWVGVLCSGDQLDQEALLNEGRKGCIQNLTLARSITLKNKYQVRYRAAQEYYRLCRNHYDVVVALKCFNHTLPLINYMYMYLRLPLPCGVLSIVHTLLICN